MKAFYLAESGVEMISTYIFINRLRYDRLRYDYARDKTASRLVAAFDQEFFDRVPVEAAARLDRVSCLEPFNHQTLSQLIAEEVALAGSPDRIKLICWEEDALLLCGRIRREFNIPGPTEIDLSVYRNKIDMKKKLMEAGIRVPRFVTAEMLASTNSPKKLMSQIAAYVGFPLIVKPIDGMGALETYKICDQTALLAFIEDHRDELLSWNFEEFIQGNIFHCDTFFHEGEPVFVGVGKHVGSPLAYVNGQTRCTIVVEPESDEWHQIKAFNEKVLESPAVSQL
ncbi:hypothetical protein VZ95_20645, partial [Elstera litoralis]